MVQCGHGVRTTCAVPPGVCNEEVVAFCLVEVDTRGVDCTSVYRGGGGGCQGTISTGIMSEGENLAASRNAEASNTLLFLSGLRTIPVISWWCLDGCCCFFVGSGWLPLFPGGLWMVAVVSSVPKNTARDYNS